MCIRDRDDNDQCAHETRPESSQPCGTEDCELAEPQRECAPHHERAGVIQLSPLQQGTVPGLDRSTGKGPGFL